MEDSNNLPYEKIGKETRCIAEEVPFEIPASWEWIRLGHICDIARGGSPRPIKDFITEDANGVNWIKIGDSDKGGKYINSTREKIKPAGVAKSRMVHAGDFLLTNSMSFGRPYILNVDGCIHDGWLVLSNYQNAFDQDFLFLMLSSAFAYQQFCGIVSGAVVKNLNSDKVAESLFPLPPLAEQKRIVAKIEELLPHLEDYDRAETRVSKLNAEFPEQLKKSILQWAIQGKLVPQDPADEPASVLLERIRAEKAKLVKAGKIKKDKNESVIFRRDNSHYTVQDGKEVCVDAKLPFDLPEGWAWCNLQTVTMNIHYGYTASAAANGNAKLLRITDIQDNQVIWDDVPFCSISKGDLPTYQIHDRDIMIARTGGTIGKTYIVRGLSETAVFASYLIRAIPVREINEEYLKLFMESPFYWRQLKDFSSGTGQPNVNGQSLKNLILPLPPLSEQKRIVEFYFSVFPEVKSLTQFSL